MAIDTPNAPSTEQEIDPFDLTIGAIKAEDAPPFLGGLVVDYQEPNPYEGKEGTKLWVVGIRPVTWQVKNETGYITNKISPSTRKKTKYMDFVEGIQTVFPTEARTLKPGRGGLVGLVAWFQTKTGGSGKFEYKVTVPVKRATEEEIAQFKALPALPENPGQPQASGATPSGFEWTEERVGLAVGILDGHSEGDGTVTKAAMKLEDADLRNQITSGRAADYLQKAGFLAEAEDGKLAKAS